MQNIVDSLQKHGVKKTAVERSLATLVEKGDVNKKEYGKAKIFLLAQDKLKLPDSQDAAATDVDLRTLTETLSETEGRLGTLRDRTAYLKGQLTLEEVTQRLNKLEDQLVSKSAKRERLGDGSSLMSKEEKANGDKRYYDIRQLWKKYKRLVKEVLDQISEATGKKISELNEDIGIETDEDVNVKFTDFPDIPNPLKANRTQPSNRIAKRHRQS